MRKELTGEEPRIWGPKMAGFGDRHYVYASGHEGDIFRTGFAPRKGNLVLYLILARGEFAPLLKELGKHTATRGCLYVKKLADIDLAILREMIAVGLTDPSLACEQPKTAKKG